MGILLSVIENLSIETYNLELIIPKNEELFQIFKKTMQSRRLRLVYSNPW